jgi:amino acid transporter
MTQPSTADRPTGDDALVRAIGVRGLAANGVNQIVGAGIFVLPAGVALTLGPSAPFAYLACGVAIGLVMLCIAEVGSRVSATGGIYAYVEAAFGPFAGFVAGVFFWLGCQVVASAVAATVFADAAAVLAPPLAGPLPRALLLVAVYTGLVVLNVRGVQVGTRAVEILTVAKVLPLVLLVVAGLAMGSRANLGDITTPPPLASVGQASLPLLLAFMGLEGALTPSGEVRNPAGTVPRAILLAIGFTTILYTAVHLSAESLLGAGLAEATRAPLAAAAKLAFGDIGGLVVIAATLVSTLGWISGDMLASPRLIYAFGRDGYLPPVFGWIHPRFRTPVVGIVIHAVTAWVLALTGTFRALVTLNVVAGLLIYVACCLAVPVLRRRDAGARAPDHFRVPFGPVVPALACGVVLWLLSSATRREFLAVGAMLGAAVVLYGARRKARRARTDLPMGVARGTSGASMN